MTVPQLIFVAVLGIIALCLFAVAAYLLIFGSPF
jgi:hypothetical protein